MKEKLELGHFEGRPWLGLPHYLTLCFMTYSFLPLLKHQAKDKKNLNDSTSSKKLD
ncbi:Mobile element protein [Neochlamydia sp. S13]|nr:Mobile element protein [Neochlamydia sp. S13]